MDPPYTHQVQKTIIKRLSEMKKKRYYEVAGHRFCVSSEKDGLGNYQPFTCAAGETVFALDVESGDAPEYTEEMRQEDEGQVIICGHTTAGEAVFEFLWRGVTAGWLVCSNNYSEGRLVTTGKYEKMAIDNALMIMFALATADKDTVLFHAAVVSYEGRGYIFLGPSGTGKSTHASLWLQHIAGTALVNDDNPVVRIDEDGSAMVYGSPWSGKTPCYRNVHYPLGAIVLLSQADCNKIQRLSGVYAYVALIESISGKRWDERIADGLHQTENALASSIPVWHLECLPDEEAAILCNETITP